jgi:hypothetical protein
VRGLQREVRSLSEVAGLLALAPREASPPPGLRDRVLARARGEGEPRSVGGAAENGGPAAGALQPGVTPPVVSLADPPRMAAAPAAAPRESGAPPVAGRTRRSRTRPLSLVPWVLLAASIAVVAPLALDYVELRREIATYARATDRLRAEVLDRNRQLAARDSVLAAVVGAEVQVVNMQATGRAPSGRIFWNPRSNRLVLAAYSIPRAPTGRTYQLWGLPGGSAPPVSLGTFNTDRLGEARVVLSVPGGTRIAASAITEEPEGGSAQPTTAPFLISTWPSDD